MAQPTFTFNPVEQTFTFSNEHLTIAAKTEIVPPPPLPPESVTVESVTLRRSIARCRTGERSTGIRGG